MNDRGPAERVQVGRVIGLWGVQGWLRIYSDTQPPDAVFSYSPWLIGPDRQPFEVDDWRRQGPRLMAHFSGLDDPDTAAALVDQVIEVERRALPTLDAGRFYWSDLIGLDVVNLQGYGYGAVSRLLETGANDVLDVRSEQGESVLIPFVLEEFIKDVDLTSRRIVVDWPVEWTQ